MSKRLAQSFYARPATVVAQALLGQILVRELDGVRLAGRIVETEAYCDGAEPDLACHGSKNGGRPTARTAVMFGPAGHIYIYLNYGLHWMFNIVTGEPDKPSAVLVRALAPVAGQAKMATLRGDRPEQEWTNGPAKLTQALAIDNSFNGASLFAPDGVIWIEQAPALSAAQLCRGPRVGLGKTPEPWFSIPWRFWEGDNPFVSSYR
ncbi:MAG: DNA-3-methyladenine glycosylase [Anaerolineales bacterium]|nr:DNA-3-methyladenine glycosylase [Anaerolineales bacterium]MCB0020533.1 DNA-3-methyladenine glycosylase [Anaerolineales bacterium]